jgi:putative radical SAM enzyme (TIGR03279 family)
MYAAFLLLDICMGMADNIFCFHMLACSEKEDWALPHTITAVQKGSAAYFSGIRPGDRLKRINGEDIIDQIDYQALSANSLLILDIEKKNGENAIFTIQKDECEPLGIALEDTLLSRPRSCRNHCVFCFIDQMPKSLRQTLYVKDDDWRLSLMMGNYITLTNISESEMDRIIRRHASPLFISVHATEGTVRRQMMNNPGADRIMEHLKRLADAGIRFHCQIVLCPGINDGPVLEKTLQDLISFYPAACSAALVPVGLTSHREGLTPLTPYTKEMAAGLISKIKPLQEQFRKSYGTAFVFPADELYCLSVLPLPSEAEYEDFPQIENGVGLLRLFISDVEQAAEEPIAVPNDLPKRITIACGVSVAPFLKDLADKFAPAQVEVDIRPISNDFFGHSITVTGLITGQDLVKQLQIVETDRILICAAMLRAEGDLFLDGLSLEDVKKALPAPLYVIPNSGKAFYRALYGITTDPEE